MAERDLFEMRLRTAVRRYAADATSEVDPFELAMRVTRQTRRGRLSFARPMVSLPTSWSGYLAWALILAALLAITIGVGALLRQPPQLGLGVPGKIAFDTLGHVIITDADGSNPIDLSPAGGDYLPNWSPDGGRLAFWRESGTTFSIVISDPMGHTLRTIRTVHPTGDPMGSGYAGGAGGPIQWSPDGTRLAVWMGVPHDDILVPRIFIVPLDGSPPYPVGDPAIPAADPMWSPDGSQLVFAGTGGWFPYPWVAKDSNGVFVMGADGSGIHRVSHEGVLTWKLEGITFREPQWQPGGDRIAYTASPDGVFLHVFTVLPDGTGTQDITLATHAEVGDEDSEVRWSPDGKRLAMTRWLATGGYHPVVANADGSSPRVYGDATVDQAPVTWSPDGKTILGYTSDAPDQLGKAVLEIDLATGSVRPFQLDFDQTGRWQRKPPP